MSKTALMRISDDDPVNLETAARLLHRLHGDRPAVVLTATDGEDRIPVSLRRVHTALEGALPGCVVHIGRNFWTGKDQSLTLAEFHQLVERTLQDQAARIRALEAAQTIPLVAPPPPAPVERVTEVERDGKGLITRLRVVSPG
jgi:hypothetical protein